MSTQDTTERALVIADAVSDLIWGGERGWEHPEADIEALIQQLRERCK